MPSNIRASITAVGHYVPPDVRDNHYFTDVLHLDTSDEWIRTRTGIVERRVFNGGPTSAMALPAVQMVLNDRGMSPADIECIIFATVSPDRVFPPTACIMQELIGAKKAWGFDLEAACSGFIYALTTGAHFIESGAHKNVLVIGADKMSAITNYTDRNTCVIFGDGAGAVLLEPTTEQHGIMDALMHSDGAGEKYLKMEGGGSLMPASHVTVDNNWHSVWQDGRTVFKFAVKGMADVSVEVMDRNNLTAADIDWLVPHQANLRIIDACAERMGLDRSKVMVNIQKYGNTTAGTIPICLSEWYHEGKLKKGQNVMLASFGAGYTWGAVWVKWAI